MGALRRLALILLVPLAAGLALWWVAAVPAPAAVPAGGPAPRFLGSPYRGHAAPRRGAERQQAGPGSDHPELDAHYRYIAAAQRPTGAIAMTPAHREINPYFANLAAQALLTRPGHLQAAERWLDWYLAHLNPDGTVDDYRVVDGAEVATGSYDSADSYAATCLSLVAAYLRAGGSITWVQARRPALERVAGVLVALTDADDGLTWAKPFYPLKLLMDNAEVWAGWEDWAGVLAALGDPEGAARARERATRVRAGLARFEEGGRYAWALGPLGFRRSSDPHQFYPGAVAQFFPFAVGSTADPTGYHRFNAAHPQWTRLASDHYPWLFAAYAAARAGDREAVAAARAAVRERFPDLRPPWFVAESAWLIRALTHEPAAVSRR